MAVTRGMCLPALSCNPEEQSPQSLRFGVVNQHVLFNLLFHKPHQTRIKGGRVIWNSTCGTFQDEGMACCVFMVTNRKQVFEQQWTKGMTGLPLLSRKDKSALRKTGHCCNQPTSPGLGWQELLVPKTLGPTSPRLCLGGSR